jgi:hypothetical protein
VGVQKARWGRRGIKPVCLWIIGMRIMNYEWDDNSQLGKLSIYLSIYLSMALQPFWTLTAIHSQEDSLDGGSVHCKAATYTQNNTNAE